MSLEKKPVLSVVMATCNRADMLPVTIESILNQSLTQFELIIINDASSDQTNALLADYVLRDKRITHIRNDLQKGCYPSRKLGIDIALGDYIAIMDDDTIAHQDRLQRQKDYLDQHAETGVVFTPANFLDEHNRIIKQEPTEEVRSRFSKNSAKDFEYLYVIQNVIPDYSVLFRKSVLVDSGGYPNGTEVGMDCFFWLQLLSKGIKIDSLSEPMMTHLNINNPQRMLSSNRAEVFRSKRVVLQAVRSWLKKEKIKKFDHLHRKALASVLAKEARFVSGVKGFRLFLQALCLDCHNIQVRQTAQRYRKRWAPF